MEALPASAFEVPEAEFLLELLVVALDAPAQLGQIDQARQGNVVGKGGEPILRGLLLGFRPFDQQPLFLTGSAAAGCVHPHARETRGELPRRTFPPYGRAPSIQRQAEGEFLDRDRLVAFAAARAGRRPPAA